MCTAELGGGKTAHFAERLFEPALGTCTYTSVNPGMFKGKYTGNTQ